MADAATPDRLREINCFDFLRFFAASIVVVAHTQADLDTEVLWNAAELFDGIGMFFIMSGMLVYQSGQKVWRTTGHWRQYFWNRYLRIAPGIYSFVVLAPLILFAAGAISARDLVQPQMVLWLGAGFWLLPNYHPPMWSDVGYGVINGHLYTIPAEVSFYLVVPLLVLAAARWGARAMLTGMLGVSILGPLVAHVLGAPIDNVLHHLFIERAGYFTAGVALAYVWPRLPKTWSLFALAAAVYFALKILGPGTLVYDVWQPVLLAAPLGYVVAFFGFRGPARAVSAFSAKGKVGDLSFGTYIWHVLIINLLLEAGWTGDWWLVPLVLALTWAAAILSWRLVEQPALRLKRVSLRRDAGSPVSAP